MSWTLRATREEVRARGGVALGAAALGLGQALLAWWAPALDLAAAPLPLLERAAAGPRALGAVLLLLLALRAADGVLPATRRDADPLGALPIHPGAARAARLLACALVLLVAPLARQLAGLAHGLAIGPAPDPSAAALAAALDVAQVAALLAAAVVARLLDPLAWPVLGSGALALTLAGRFGHLDAHLDPLRLGELRLAPSPGLTVAAAWLGAATLVLLAVTTLGGRGGHGLLRRALDAAFAPEGFGRANARVAALLGPLLVVATPLCAAAPDRRVASAAAAGRALTNLAAHDTTSVRTRRYRFVYPSALAAPARALVRRADALHDAVVALLGLPPSDPLDPPLTVTLQPPAALDPAADPCGVVMLDAAAPTALAHATTHALLRRACGPLERERTWLLEEGLAVHAAWRVTGGDPFAPRFVAAVLHARRPFGDEEHLGPAALERARGPEAVGVLGEAHVEAARRLAGDEAGVFRLVTALGRRDLPRVHGAAAGWAALLGAAGLEPAAVREEVLVVIEDSAPRDPRADLDLPRLLVLEELQESQDLKLVAVPDAPLPADWDVVCRVVLDPSAADARPVPAVRLGPDRTGCFGFSRRDDLLRFGPRPRVQVGVRPLRPGPFQGTIWEEWTQLPFLR